MTDPFETIRGFRLRIQQLEEELAFEKANHAVTLGRLMEGEHLRERLMIKAICAGAFSPEPATEKEQHGTDSPAI